MYEIKFIGTVPESTRRSRMVNTVIDMLKDLIGHEVGGEITVMVTPDKTQVTYGEAVEIEE